MIRFKNIYVFVLIGFFVSCSNVSPDDLIDVPDLGEETLITYNSNVKAILDNNCIFCHSDPPVNGAPIPLTNYDQVRSAIENNNLINRISTQDLGNVMPPGGPRLPQNLIDIIVQWEVDGLPEDDN